MLKTIYDSDYDSCKEYDKVSNMVWLDIKQLCIKILPAQSSEVISAEKVV
ncbi:MAG: hypothetical protein LBH81_01490 [Rickettsiales bacterium]|nr:hypothetical protein [Rickettsiales bacterium]